MKGKCFSWLKSTFDPSLPLGERFMDLTVLVSVCLCSSSSNLAQAEILGSLLWVLDPEVSRKHRKLIWPSGLLNNAAEMDSLGPYGEPGRMTHSVRDDKGRAGSKKWEQSRQEQNGDADRVMRLLSEEVSWRRKKTGQREAGKERQGKCETEGFETEGRGREERQKCRVTIQRNNEMIETKNTHTHKHTYGARGQETMMAWHGALTQYCSSQSAQSAVIISKKIRAFYFSPSFCHNYIISHITMHWKSTQQAPVLTIFYWPIGKKIRKQSIIHWPCLRFCLHICPSLIFLLNLPEVWF